MQNNIQEQNTNVSSKNNINNNIKDKKHRIFTSKNNRLSLAIICLIVLASIGLGSYELYAHYIVPKGYYDTAEQYKSNKKYDKAIAEYKKAEGFKDSKQQIIECRKQNLKNLIETKTLDFMYFDNKTNSILISARDYPTSNLADTSSLPIELRDMIASGYVSLYAKELKFADYNDLYDRMKRATSADGEQSETHNGYKISWSYNSVRGFRGKIEVVE